MVRQRAQAIHDIVEGSIGRGALVKIVVQGLSGKRQRDESPILLYIKVGLQGVIISLLIHLLMIFYVVYKMSLDSPANSLKILSLQ